MVPQIVKGFARCLLKDEKENRPRLYASEINGSREYGFGQSWVYC